MERFIVFLLTASIFVFGACTDKITNPEEVSLPETISVVSGNGQSVSPGRILPNKPIIEIKDQNENPAHDILVRFEVIKGSGVLTSAIAVSDNEGRAVLPAWQLGPGMNLVRATVEDTELSTLILAIGVNEGVHLQVDDAEIIYGGLSHKQTLVVDSTALVAIVKENNTYLYHSSLGPIPQNLNDEISKKSLALKLLSGHSNDITSSKNQSSNNDDIAGVLISELSANTYRFENSKRRMVGIKFTPEGKGSRLLFPSGNLTFASRVASLLSTEGIIAQDNPFFDRAFEEKTTCEVFGSTQTLTFGTPSLINDWLRLFKPSIQEALQSNPEYYARVNRIDATLMVLGAFSDLIGVVTEACFQALFASTFSRSTELLFLQNLADEIGPEAVKQASEELLYSILLEGATCLCQVGTAGACTILAKIQDLVSIGSLILNDGIVRTIDVSTTPAYAKIQLGDTQQGQPDLSVAAISFNPLNPTNEDPITVNFTLANNGNAPSGTLQWRLFFNGNVLATESTASIGAGQSRQLSYNLGTNPAATIPIKVQVDPNGDIEETNENNNEKTVNLIVGEQQLPDLSVASISFSPANPTNEDPVTVNVTLANNGNASSGSFQWRLFYNGNVLATESTSSLGAGQSRQLSYNLGTNPAATIPIKVQVDPNGDIEETNENNNEKTVNLIVGEQQLPDLSVASISFSPANPTNEDPVTVNVTLANNGNASSGSFQWRLFYNGNVLATESTSSLGAGQSRQLSYNLGTNPAATIPIKVQVDPNGDIEESNENNNEKTENLTIVSAIDERPDLSVASISFSPANPTNEDPVTVNVTLANNGNASSGSFQWRLFYNGNVLATESTSSLGAGQSRQLSYNLGTNPAATIPIKVQVDPNGDIEETNENNNEKTVNLIVGEQQLPDLSVASISFSPANPTNEDPVTVNVTLANNGNASSGSFQWRLFYNGNVLATESTSSLGAGQSRQLSYNLGTNPAATIPIKVQVDPNGDIEESNENNNERTENLTIIQEALPDLSVASISFNPANPTNEDPVTVNFTLANNGNAPSGSLQWRLFYNGTPITTDSTPSLDVGQSRQLGYDLGTNPIGTIPIKVQIDPNGVIQEINENNNQKTANLLVSESTGNIKVSNTTSGQDIPGSPFTAILDVANNTPPTLSIPVNGSVIFNDVAQGTHTITLGGVDENCNVSGGITQNVSVIAGNTATVTYTVTCQSTSPGSIKVSNTTTGQNIPTAPYTAILDVASDNPPVLSIPVNGSVTFNNIVPGSHTITLGGVDANCSTSGGITQNVMVSSGNTANSSFSITCD